MGLGQKSARRHKTDHVRVVTSFLVHDDGLIRLLTFKYALPQCSLP